MANAVIKLKWEESEPPRKGFGAIGYSYEGDEIPPDVITHLVLAYMDGRLKKENE